MKFRKIANHILQRSNTPFGRIIVLTGARQVGKTTLAKELFSEYQYISIEDPYLRNDYKKLSAEQWSKLYPKAILDEVQKEPVLIDSIKAVYDQYSQSRYVLLGSSQLLLLEKVKETMAGRCLIYEVFPLTLPEIRSKNWNDTIEPSFFQSFCIQKSISNIPHSFKLDKQYADKTNALEHYLKFGGYPALVSEGISDDLKWEWLANYVRTYLERDVRDLAEFKNLEPFVKTQKITALLSGQIINFSQIAREASIAANTAQRFLHYLELSYQTILIQPWYKNELKRLIKSPKLHYLDPGVQRTILQKKGELTGNEFESAIVAEIYKQIRNAQINCQCYHLLSFDGKEIDLLLEFEEGYVAIEIKKTEKVHSSDIRHFKDLESILDKPVLHCFLISNDSNIQQFGDSILAIPVALFLG